MQLISMVGDTRSAQKGKDEGDGRSPLKKNNIITDPSTRCSEKSDVRRSGKETSVCRKTTTSPKSMCKSKETSLSRHRISSPQSSQKSKEITLLTKAIPSPQDMRKSKRLEMGMPSSSPVNKNERLTPKRWSGQGRDNLASSSSGLIEVKKSLCQSQLKKKKERDLIQVTMESEKVEVQPFNMKRKKMNGQIFKASFKRQCIREVVPGDGNGELEVPEKSSHSCSSGNRDNEEDINIYPSSRGNADDEPYPIDSHASFDVREPFDFYQSFRANLFSNEDVNSLESESSMCLARSRDGSISLESREKCAHSKGTMPSPTPKCGSWNLLENCVQCLKRKRVGYDSPEEELCTCDPIVNNDPGGFFVKDRNDHGAAVTSESADKCLQMEMDVESHTVGQANVCCFCFEGGELLCCVGKGCKRCYHVYCLDPSLPNALPGVWHCPQCVKNQLLFGVHSVSRGFEYICDVREVELSNRTGDWQKQYLVKYHGLAHIHNHWVPESQLLLENPSLISDFTGNSEVVRWCTEWTVPQRLLRRRCIHDKIFIASTTVISVCNYEWLVKWHGQSYDLATWELDCAPFLSSPLGVDLVKHYEIRHQRAHQEVNKHNKESIGKLSKLPDIQSHVNENVLNNVNKLRERLSQSQNAVIIDDQERIMTIILLLESAVEICWPFLIVTASGSLSQWEAEFADVQSVDVVVYSGNRNTRKGIRASEFYDEEGQMMLQVMLTSAEAIQEDVDILRSIKWEAVVIDEHQHSWTSNDHKQINMLCANSRILLSSGQRKDTIFEYNRMLPLHEIDGDCDKLRGLRSEINDCISKSKDRLSHFIVYGNTSQVPKFVEYWVPVELSNYQLEQYCYTLLSNSIALRSCSRSDLVGALRYVILTVRKCCDHPYLLDTTVQEQLFAEKRPASNILDIGVKASGKLQLLDAMLTEIKTQGLHVLVLFQLITGSGGASTGDILDDFLRQRFGPNTYERIDAAVTPHKRPAIVNRFNKKETGQFVFLLENRACSSSIKLSSLDVVVIYDSDLNPANDLKALQRISMDSNFGKIKVFRLYSCFTVEERALIFAKQHLNLDNHLQSVNRAASDSLLSWGASNLFRKLDEYHAAHNSITALTFSSEHVLLNEVIKEFQELVSENCSDANFITVISKAVLGAQSYTTNVPIFGESKVQLDKEEPHVFWRNLFEGRKPQWKHPCPRSRKRGQHTVASKSKLETDKNDVIKKCKKATIMDPALVQVELEVNKGTQDVVANRGPHASKPCIQSRNLQEGQRSFSVEVSAGVSEKRTAIHNQLQEQITRLCHILHIAEDVTQIVQRFLEYVIKNHHINSASSSIMQAFQISLCWIAVSITKQKIDKRNSLLLAKQLLNYQCSEEQVCSVYCKMRLLKRMFLQSSGKSINGDICVLANDDTGQELYDAVRGSSEFLSDKQKHGKRKIGENSGNEELAGGEAPSLKKLAQGASADATEMNNKTRKMLKKFEKQMNKLKVEYKERNIFWDKEQDKLETDHKLESAFIRSIHGQGTLGMNKLKLFEEDFVKKMEAHNLQKKAELEILEAKLLACEEEKRKLDQWLAKARSSPGVQIAVNETASPGSHSEDVAVCPQTISGINVTSPGEVLPVCGLHLEDQSTSNHSCENGATPSIIPESASTEFLHCDTPVGNVATLHLQKEVGASLMDTIIPQSKDSCENEGNVDNPSVSDKNLPVDVCDEPLTVVPKPFQNDVAVQAQPSELRTTSMKEPNKGNRITLPAVSEAYPPGTDLDERLQNTGQPLETSIVPNFSSLQDTIDQTQASTVLENLDAPALENQSTSNIQVTTVETNCETTDEIVTIQPSNDEVLPLTESVHSPASNCTLSNNEHPATVVHDQGKITSQTAEPLRTELPSHENVSEEEISETQGIHLVRLSTLEPTNQAVQPAGMDAVHGPSFLAHPTHQPTCLNSTPSLVLDPLRIELERMCKETEQLVKNQEDLASQLKFECEKEIQEIIAQIRNKYDKKFQESEAEFRLKRNELERNKNKIFVNKALAEAFRSKCLNSRSPELPVAQGFMQYLQQVLCASSLRPSLVTSSSEQTVQQQQQPPPPPPPPPRQSHLVRLSPAATTLAQALHPAPVRASGTSSSRPPLIGAISPSGITRVAGEVRSPAPHLQAFRPRAPPVSQPAQPHVLPLSQTSRDPEPQGGAAATLNQSPPVSQPAQPHVLLLSQTLREPEPQGGAAATLNESTLAADMDYWSVLENSSQLADLGELGYKEVSAEPAADLFCISDDD